jgi:filamentous hemagglutinin family protein
MKMKNNNTTIKKNISKSMISVFTCSVLASAALANPTTGGTVKSGTATIDGTTPTAMTVTQTTPNAIINWKSFNVDSGESVTFKGGNATLNRISDASASTIAGTVTGDHALFFVNPNGITVTGAMSAPTIVLSTLDIADADFNAGTYKFTRGTAAGAIINSGTISDGGQIGSGGQTGNIGVAALFAATVQNSGTIQSNNVAIVAADAVTLGATTSAVYGSGAYNATANGYNGVSAIPAATVATSIQNNTMTSNILAVDNGLNSGKIDIYSTNGKIDNSNYGTICSQSQSGSSGDVTIQASGDILNTRGQIFSQGRAGSAGAIHVTSTNGLINNNLGYIYSKGTDSSGGAVTVHAYGDVINTGDGKTNYSNAIFSAGDGSVASSGAVTVTSDTGKIDNSGYGTIFSKSQSGSSGDVTVQASGDILNTSGEIFSQMFNGIGSAGAIHVTSTNGLINNNLGQIWSESAGSSSGAITVHAYGDVINTGDGKTNYSSAISSVGDGSGTLSGAVTVTSDNGKIDNSSWGVITSGSSTGVIILTAHTLIDLRNGGTVATFGATAGDVTLTAPSLFFTPYTTNTNIDSESVVVSQAGITDSSMVPHDINIIATTINGTNVSSLSQNDFQTTTTHFVSSSTVPLPYVWYGNVNLTPPSSNTGSGSTSNLTPPSSNTGSGSTSNLTPPSSNTGSGSTSNLTPIQVAQQKQTDAVNTVSTIISSQLASTTNTLSSNPVINNNHMQTAESGSGLAQSSFVNNISDGNANHSNNSHESGIGAMPMQRQMKFTVGADIVGTGNATASSTVVPGVFILSSSKND